jgi:hypothetical protein
MMGDVQISLVLRSTDLSISHHLERDEQPTIAINLLDLEALAIIPIFTFLIQGPHVRDLMLRGAV